MGYKSYVFSVLWGHAVAQLVKALRYKPEGRGFDSRRDHWNFSLTQSFRLHYGPGVDSASNRNEYLEYFLRVKAAGAYGWQPYHLLVPIVLKSGSLKLLKPSGPAQACNWIGLPFAFILRTVRNKLVYSVIKGQVTVMLKEVIHVCNTLL